jgi:hypothetical protein
MEAKQNNYQTMEAKQSKTNSRAIRHVSSSQPQAANSAIDSFRIGVSAGSLFVLVHLGFLLLKSKT